MGKENRRIVTLAALTASCILTVFLWGCGNALDPPETGDSWTVGFLASEFSNEFLIAMQQSFLDQAELLGLEVNMVICSTDLTAQVDQAEDLIAQGVDALVLRPTNPEVALTLVERANEKQIPVFLYDTYVNEGEVASIITTDNYAVGRIAADAMAQELRERTGEAQGKIAILAGMQELSSHRDRLKGFCDRMEAAYPKIEIRSIGREESDEKVLDLIQTWLALYGPELYGIYSVSDISTVLAVEEIHRQGCSTNWRDKDGITVISVDGTPNGIALIREKAVAGIVSQNAMEIGRKTADMVLQYLEGKEPVASFCYIPSMLITPENVDREEVQEFGLWADLYMGKLREGR